MVPLLPNTIVELNPTGTLTQPSLNSELDPNLMFSLSGRLCAYVPGQPHFHEAFGQLLCEPAG